MREIKKVWLHCSGVEFGTYGSIDEAHRQRGWSGVYDDDRNSQVYCGYHYVIEGRYKNQISVINNRPDFLHEGKVIKGRPDYQIGAHVKGCNSDSIGICYIGISISPIQFLSLQNLLLQVLRKNNLIVDDVLGHYEVYGKADDRSKLYKTCPNIRMDVFRDYLKNIYPQEVI